MEVHQLASAVGRCHEAQGFVAHHMVRHGVQGRARAGRELLMNCSGAKVLIYQAPHAVEVEERKVLQVSCGHHQEVSRLLESKVAVRVDLRGSAQVVLCVGVAPRRS